MQLEVTKPGLTCRFHFLEVVTFALQSRTSEFNRITSWCHTVCTSSLIDSMAGLASNPNLFPEVGKGGIHQHMGTKPARTARHMRLKLPADEAILFLNTKYLFLPALFPEATRTRKEHDL